MFEDPKTPSSPEFYVKSEQAYAEEEMAKAIEEMGPAQINRVYETDGDNAPLEGGIGDMEKLLRIVEQDREGLRHGKYSLLNGHGHRETIVDFGKQVNNCGRCSLTQTMVVVKTHASYVYECNACKLCFWLPLDVGQPIFEPKTFKVRVRKPRLARG